jgi:quinol monooxygenase YgiN
MIKRIVKMQFRPDAVHTFRTEVFDPSKHLIRAFEGCLYMELLEDLHEPTQLFTMSIWESEEALNKYRQSELFKQTWVKTKALFAEKAEAWSTDVVDKPCPI